MLDLQQDADFCRVEGETVHDLYCVDVLQLVRSMSLVFKYLTYAESDVQIPNCCVPLMFPGAILVCSQLQADNWSKKNLVKAFVSRPLMTLL